MVSVSLLLRRRMLFTGRLGQETRKRHLWTQLRLSCTIFFEGEWKNANIYNYGLIVVENSDEDVQVTFYLTDAHEMNWITEFADAPYFARSETE